MQTQAAVWHGILLALESAGITLLALILAGLIWLGRVTFDEFVLVPLLERQPRHGLIRGFLDWAEERWRRWRSGVVSEGMPLRERVGVACFAVFAWGFGLLMLYRLAAGRTDAVMPENSEEAYLPVLVGLVIVVIAGPLELKRGLRTLPYPVSERHPTRSYLAADPGFNLPLSERYIMASLINMLRLSRILIVASLMLCLPEVGALANTADVVGDTSYDLAAVVYAAAALAFAFAMIQALHAMLLRVWVFEQIDVLLAGHHPEAFGNPPKHTRKKLQIGLPLKRVQRGIDRLAYRVTAGHPWHGRVLEAVADRIDVYRNSRAGSNDRELDPAGIELLERAGAILASYPDTKAVMAFAAPAGVVDAEEHVVRVDRVPERPSWFVRATASVERGWKLVVLILTIAAAVGTLVAAATGRSTWGDFWSQWGPG
ncbi:hypothetical protein SAMN05216298_0424 [Glycomyces sambucus]|uniref:Uncharacterized protein n=1 Tax=Glycomyces sambucus TaxID=380244 RepID=A0A1G9CNF0_9ACTN|nr:hypothetical protein [Glycomyces sambucus]SDK52965.1 hypothetical protein SAMN05216298_0424 [Glycomyces sambucus]